MDHHVESEWIESRYIQSQLARSQSVLFVVTGLVAVRARVSCFVSRVSCPGCRVSGLGTRLSNSSYDFALSSVYHNIIFDTLAKGLYSIQASVHTVTGPVDEEKRSTLKRFAAVGAAGPFVGTTAEENTDDNKTREAIRGYLSTTPGAHFSKLRDELQLGTGETQYHLRKLESDATIESRKDGDYRRFFPAEQFSAFEQTALGYLRRETSRYIVVTLLQDPTTNASDIAARAGVSAASISRAAASLESAGILTRESGYSLQHLETLTLLLVRYAGSFDDTTIEFAANADQILEYSPER